MLNIWSTDVKKVSLGSSLASRCFYWEDLTHLSPDWVEDIKHSTYKWEKLDVSWKDINMEWVFFSTDGLILFFIWSTSDSVYQYDLTKSYDLSTATYTSVFSITSEDNDPEWFSFKDDWTKMYIVWNQNNTVYQYTLATAWDLSTASYDSVSFSTSGQTSVPWDMTIVNWGSTMFVISRGNFKWNIYQYTLSTPWDLSTASYDSKSLQVTSWLYRGAIAFSPDWKYIFHAWWSGFSFRMIELTVAFDLWASVAWISKLYLNDFWVGRWLHFTWNWSSFFIVFSWWIVRKFSICISWLLRKASYNSISYSPIAEDNNMKWMKVWDWGSKLYMIWKTAPTIFQYTLSTDWDLSTISYSTKSFAIWIECPNPLWVTFKPDWTKMFLSCKDTWSIYQYSLGIAWDISTTTYDTILLDILADVTTLFDIKFNNDWSSLYILDNTWGDENSTIRQYNMSINWDITTAIYFWNYSIPRKQPNAFVFNSDWTEIFYVLQDWKELQQTRLTTPFNITTWLTVRSSLSLIPESLEPRWLDISIPDWKVIIIEDNLNLFLEYIL